LDVQKDLLTFSFENLANSNMIQICYNQNQSKLLL